MNKKLILLCLPFFILSFTKYYEPIPKYVNDGQSVNGKLISIYNNTVFINKKDAIYQYDLNGNSIAFFIQNTAYNYPIISNIDSLLIKNEDNASSIISLNQSTKNNIIASKYYNFNISDIVQLNNYILILDKSKSEYIRNRFSEFYVDTLTYKNKYTNFKNFGNITFPYKENVYAIEKINDSLAFLLTKNIELFNINQPNKAISRVLTLNADFDNFTKMKFVNNQLIISNANKVWFYTYNKAANTLTLNAEIN